MLLAVLLSSLTAVSAIGRSLPFGVGGRTIHQYREEAAETPTRLRAGDIDPADLYPVRHFHFPINHFPNESRYDPHVNGTFRNRYWFDASHYQPGGPVIVLQSGESNAAERLPFLQKGILAQLAEATHGLAVVLEHRYYGESFPTDSLSTADLRFLSTEQGMADEAYFAQNIIFPGLEHVNLTSHTTAYISYGGSYPGAMSAFLRVRYPHIFWGSISSAGVTKAIHDYWQYFAVVSEYGPGFCMTLQKLFTNMVDNILIRKNDSTLAHDLKALFGLESVTADADFANILSSGVGWWQSLNWDPEVSNPRFYEFCGNISAGELFFPDLATKSPEAARILEEGGYTAHPSYVVHLLNYIGWLNMTETSACSSKGFTQDQCFSNTNATSYQQHGLDTYGWRSWAWQYCTEWGYLATGSGVPAEQMPLISRTIDIEYLSSVCKYAFGVTDPPAVDVVNKYGGYEISYPRLAIIDGEWDPWRPATPHAFEYGAKPRNSTTSEPFLLIPEALHHYDENGRFANETTPDFPPKSIVRTQREEVRFGKAWMEEWRVQCRTGERAECFGVEGPDLVVQ